MRIYAKKLYPSFQFGIIEMNGIALEEKSACDCVWGFVNYMNRYRKKIQTNDISHSFFLLCKCAQLLFFVVVSHLQFFFTRFNEQHEYVVTIMVCNSSKDFIVMP